ncbi:hypothetical protein, partial [Moritella sp. F3]|uniref:hypothetical protein n=1 Tax=Moritella sp. F3 TaxID=2718882 RepID=UPI0018E19A7F
YARLDVGNTFQGVSIFNSQGQFKQNVVVGGMLTASTLKVGGDVSIDGTATAADFKLKDAYYGKRSIKEAFKWIADCEAGKIDACVTKEAAKPTPPAVRYGFTAYMTGPTRVFSFASGDKAGSSKYNAQHYGLGGRSCYEHRKGTRCSYKNGKRVSKSYTIHNATIQGAKVRWSVGSSVKWTGKIGQAYTPITGRYNWTISILDSKNKVIASALVNIGNNGYGGSKGSGVYY